MIQMKLLGFLGNFYTNQDNGHLQDQRLPSPRLSLSDSSQLQRPDHHRIPGIQIS